MHFQALTRQRMIERMLTPKQIKALHNEPIVLLDVRAIYGSNVLIVPERLWVGPAGFTGIVGTPYTAYEGEALKFISDGFFNVAAADLARANLAALPGFVADSNFVEVYVYAEDAITTGDFPIVVGCEYSAYRV